MWIKRREKIKCLKVRGEIEESSIDPYSMFLFAIMYLILERNALGGWDVFWCYWYPGCMTERSKAFCENAKYDIGLSLSHRCPIYPEAGEKGRKKGRTC
jgi:hypothetical protein